MTLPVTLMWPDLFGCITKPPMYLLVSQEGFSDYMIVTEMVGGGTIICGLKNFESETFLCGRNYLSERINFWQMLWMQTLCELFSLFCLFSGVGVGVVIRWYMVWFEIDRPFASLVILAWHHSVPTQSVLKFRRCVWRYKWIGFFVAKIWWSTYSLYSIKIQNVSLYCCILLSLAWKQWCLVSWRILHLVQQKTLVSSQTCCF